MTGRDPAGRKGLTEHDRSRLRRARRVAAAGPVAGAIGALALAAAGATGRAGLAALLLLSALGCVAAALLLLVHALVDEYRREPVALRRIGWAVGLLFITALLLVLLGGVAGEAP